MDLNPDSTASGERRVDAALSAFRDEVGADDPVCVVGGRTRWTVGGPVAEGVREVRAPIGVVAVEPAELIVRVRAGTTVAALDAELAAVGQHSGLSSAAGGGGSTVGGVLAVGRSGIDALRWGPVRSTLLEATFVDAWGRVARAGAPVVKNVAGYDLCRLLVGSLGTLGLIGEVVLRTRPLPAAGAWWTGPADASVLDAVVAGVERPSSVLWDGTHAWVHVEGHPLDVEAAGAALAALGCGTACDGPPPLPVARASVPAAAVRELPHRLRERFVVEVGTGIVHASPGDAAGTVSPPSERVLELHRTVAARFDPTGRLNPGRSPLRAGVAP